MEISQYKPIWWYNNIAMSISHLSFKQILFFAGCILALLFFIYLGLSPFISGQKGQPIAGDFKTDYSNFNKLKPGKDTIKDIISLNGNPQSEKKSGEKTYLYYSTPSDRLKNVAVLQSGRLLYATEEVFEKYRGAPDEYVKKFGKPDLIMYGLADSGTEWWIYPSVGVAIDVASFEKTIVRILYFVPQKKENFIRIFSEELGLNEKKIIPSETFESSN